MKCSDPQCPLVYHGHSAGVACSSAPPPSQSSTPTGGGQTLIEEAVKAIEEVAANARLTLVHVAASKPREEWARNEITSYANHQIARLRALGSTGEPRRDASRWDVVEKCPNCENGSGYTRHLGREGEEVVGDCPYHLVPEPDPAPPGETTDTRAERALRDLMRLTDRGGPMADQAVYMLCERALASPSPQTHDEGDNK